MLNKVIIMAKLTLFSFYCFVSPVSVNKMTASSERCMSPPYFARLHLPGTCFSAWCSKPHRYDSYPWLSVNLGDEYYILYVATQGSGSKQNEHFVFRYKLRYSLEQNASNWYNYEEKGRSKVPSQWHRI